MLSVKMFLVALWRGFIGLTSTSFDRFWLLGKVRNVMRNARSGCVQDRQTVTCPRKVDKVSSANMVQLKILKILEFNSQTLKSGVVVRADDGPTGGSLLFLRGAPLAIKQTGMGIAASLPADFDAVRN